MNDIQTAKFLGLFSLALGMAEVAFPRQIARALNLQQSPELVRAFGARELMAGGAVLAYPDNALPVWTRVAGDALDLAVLLGTLRNREMTGAARLATLAVLGITALDVATALALMARHKKALATGRRTRVRKQLAA